MTTKYHIAFIEGKTHDDKDFIKIINPRCTLCSKAQILSDSSIWIKSNKAFFHPSNLLLYDIPEKYLPYITNYLNNIGINQSIEEIKENLRGKYESLDTRSYMANFNKILMGFISELQEVYLVLSKILYDLEKSAIKGEKLAPVEINDKVLYQITSFNTKFYDINQLVQNKINHHETDQDEITELTTIMNRLNENLTDIHKMIHSLEQHNNLFKKSHDLVK